MMRTLATPAHQKGLELAGASRPAFRRRWSVIRRGCARSS
jgi:hypothetical protein